MCWSTLISHKPTAMRKNGILRRPISPGHWSGGTELLLSGEREQYLPSPGGSLLEKAAKEDSGAGIRKGGGLSYNLG